MKKNPIIAIKRLQVILKSKKPEIVFIDDGRMILPGKLFLLKYSRIKATVFKKLNLIAKDSRLEYCSETA